MVSGEADSAADRFRRQLPDRREDLSRHLRRARVHQDDPIRSGLGRDVAPCAHNHVEVRDHFYRFHITGLIRLRVGGSCGAAQNQNSRDGNNARDSSVR